MIPMMPANLRIEQQQREKELTRGALSSLDDRVYAEIEARSSEETVLTAQNEPDVRPVNNRSLWRRLVSPKLQHNLK